ncbi:MAG TPA: PatB family C-S lyase [Anaerolineaceae bacterium]
MASIFDEVIDRKSTESIKWKLFGPDVLPMWVADMDFRAPEPVIQALQERVAHGVFGYPAEPAEMRGLLVERMQRLYAWNVQPDEIVFLPGVVTGFNQVAHALAGPGGGVLMQTPVYHPFFGVAPNIRGQQDEMELTHQPNGSYSVDWDAFEAAIHPQTRMFLLCNPHNPVGRVFRQDELEKMAEICLRRGLTICSDEIHADFIYTGHRHIPIASLSPEVAQRTVTLMAPSKTFNIAGLECSFAIIQDPALRKQVEAARMGLVPSVNLLGAVAATAAYRSGQLWLDELLAYLEQNIETMAQFIAAELPGVRMCKPEGTYLAWLDCRETGLTGDLCEFFIKNGGVAFNNGAMFGKGGQGFVRLNFGCPRSTLLEGLQRMKTALEKR